MAQLDNGEYLASRVKCLKRIHEYMQIAETGNKERLLAFIDRNTLDDDAHPNGVLYELLVIVLSLYNGMGRSPIPSIEKAIAAARGDKLGSQILLDAGIVLPGQN